LTADLCRRSSVSSLVSAESRRRRRLQPITDAVQRPRMTPLINLPRANRPVERATAVGRAGTHEACTAAGTRNWSSPSGNELYILQSSDPRFPSGGLPSRRRAGRGWPRRHPSVVVVEAWPSGAAWYLCSSRCRRRSSGGQASAGPWRQRWLGCLPDQEAWPLGGDSALRPRGRRLLGQAGCG
jgi:hypothetical protein